MNNLLVLCNELSALAIKYGIPYWSFLLNGYLRFDIYSEPYTTPDCHNAHGLMSPKAVESMTLVEIDSYALIKFHEVLASASEGGWDAVSKTV